MDRLFVKFYFVPLKVKLGTVLEPNNLFRGSHQELIVGSKNITLLDYNASQHKVINIIFC